MRPSISTGVQKTITVATAIRMLAPQADMELSTEHKEWTNEAAYSDEISYWMVVAKEVFIITEHQQQIESP